MMGDFGPLGRTAQTGRGGRVGRPYVKTQQAGGLSWHQLPGLGQGHHAPHRNQLGAGAIQAGRGAHSGCWPEWGQMGPRGQETRRAAGKMVLGQKAPRSWLTWLLWRCVPREGGLEPIQARAQGGGPSRGAAPAHLPLPGLAPERSAARLRPRGPSRLAPAQAHSGPRQPQRPMTLRGWNGLLG